MTGLRAGVLKRAAWTLGLCLTWGVSGVGCGDSEGEGNQPIHKSDAGGSGGSGGTAVLLDAEPPDSSNGEGAAGAAATAGTGGTTACPDAEKRGRFGLNIDPQNPAGNPNGSELTSLGARWVRIEWKVGVDATAQSQVIAKLRAAGVRVLLIVDYASVAAPLPGKTAGSAAWDTYLTTYAAKLKEVVGLLGTGVDAWELWNEPDHPGEPGYEPYVPPESYGKLLVQSTTTIRAASQAPVILGGLASGNPGYVDSVLQQIGQLPVDGIGVHPYGQRAPDNWPDASWGFGNMSTLFDNYLKFGLPLWVTEIGTVDQPRQAEYVGNVFALAESYGVKVPLVFWFCYSDGMVPPHGLIDISGTPKDSYGAFKNAAPTWDPACEPGLSTP